MKALSILLLLIGYSALVPLITHAHPTPVIFVHGMLGAGDNYHHLAHRLHQAGWPAAFLHAFNWNTLARGNTAEKLDSLVNRVLAQTGQRQVVLAGHSAGGGVCYQYMNDSGRAAKVYKYVHIASTAAKTLPGPAAAPIPTLNLFSQADYVVRSASIVGAVNKAFASMDHFGIVSGDSTADAVIDFLADSKRLSSKPSLLSTTTFQVLQFGGNEPEVGATIVCYMPGKNNTWLPVDSIITDHTGKATLRKPLLPGSWLIECRPQQGRTIRYYYPALPQTPLPLYLRTLPATGMASLVLGQLPRYTDKAVTVVFNARSAFSPGHPPVILGTDTLNTAQRSPVAKTVVGMFLYDNGDGQTTWQPHASMQALPFMQGFDVAFTIENNSRQNLPLFWQGKWYQVPLVAASQAIHLIVLP